ARAIASRSRRCLGGGAQTGGVMARVSRAIEERPLEGRTIVITRARAQAQRFAQLLEAAGARVLQAPTIVIEAPASWELLDTALGALDSFTWVVFTSVNGVAMVDRRLSARGLAWAAITRKRVAAIGPATAEALAEHGVRVELGPPGVARGGVGRGPAAPRRPRRSGAAAPRERDARRPGGRAPPPRRHRDRGARLPDPAHRGRRRWPPRRARIGLGRRRG